MKTPIPEVNIKEFHWKVGDNMGLGPKDPNAFGIAQIAVVDEKNGNYDIRFFDVTGRERGGIKMKVRK